jgi:uncharacterized coiled-coil protein SlyX
METIMSLKLIISCTLQIGNGYRCSCCASSSDRELEEYTIEGIINTIRSFGEFEDDLYHIDTDTIVIHNLKPHHDAEPIKERIAEILDAEIDRSNRMYELKKSIGSAQNQKTASERFIASIDKQVADHKATIEKMATQINTQTTELEALQNSGWKFK